MKPKTAIYAPMALISLRGIAPLCNKIHANFCGAEEPLIENVLPGFDGLRLESAGVGRRELFATFKGEGGKNICHFDKLSDGQRALIALYAFILGGNPHRLLLLDEPDNYVTLPEIQPLLAEMEDECGDELPQIVLASHHPEAIDF